MLRGKKILIGITASIAAYKIPLLIRLLKKEGAEIKVLLTPDAKHFVTPLTLSVLSENPVLSTAFNLETGEWNSHVELGLWADLFILAPLTANSMAKMATGVADNFLLTTYLSAKCPVYFAPAMDLDMFKHTTTTENIKTIQKRGNHLIAPGEGELASGLCGEGRMEEPEEIFNIIQQHFQKELSFKGKKVLVTAGPTYEKIDPVRFIGNFSSGLMGYEIADKFAKQGAEVYLVSGPSNLSVTHKNVYKIDVVSAQEMFEACKKLHQDVDIIVMAAAVADYTPDSYAHQKIKKKIDLFKIALKPTTDILAWFGKNRKENQFIVGFALETNNEVENAINKIKNKNIDLIVLNSLQDEDAGFGKSTNKISIIDSKERITPFETKDKTNVAVDIVDMISKYL